MLGMPLVVVRRFLGDQLFGHVRQNDLKDLINTGFVVGIPIPDGYQSTCEADRVRDAANVVDKSCIDS